MTQDKARKSATRQRMAETGEPYCEARRAAERDRESGTDPASPGPDDPKQRLARARAAAEEAQELADSARERFEQADEAAMMAHDAADMAAEAASLTRGWADPQEQEQTQRRADQARAAAHEAQHRADLAELQADQAQEAADLAQEFADEAEELDCEADSGEFEDEEFEDGPRGWVHRGDRTHGHPDHHGRPGRPGPVPPLPPLPPHPPGPPGHSQNRVEQILWRFDQFRERAEEIVSRAERILNLGHEESRPALLTRTDTGSRRPARSGARRLTVSPPVDERRAWRNRIVRAPGGIDGQKASCLARTSSELTGCSLAACMSGRCWTALSGRQLLGRDEPPCPRGAPRRAAPNAYAVSSEVPHYLINAYLKGTAPAGAGVGDGAPRAATARTAVSRPSGPRGANSTLRGLGPEQRKDPAARAQDRRGRWRTRASAAARSAAASWRPRMTMVAPRSGVWAPGEASPNAATRK